MPREVVMWIYVIAAIPLTLLGLWWMRKDYRERGRLSVPGFTALLVMFFVPHLALHYAIDYSMPSAVGKWVGIAVAVIGLALCVWGMVTFRSVSKIFAFNPGTLATSGPYRWSRNPQYVGWGLFFFSFAVMGWTRDCIIPLGLFVVIVHYMVLAEEEHLARVFGEEYEAFRRQVPRYFGFRPAAQDPSTAQ